jgi:hypothetical protein
MAHKRKRCGDPAGLAVASGCADVQSHRPPRLAQSAVCISAASVSAARLARAGADGTGARGCVAGNAVGRRAGGSRFEQRPADQMVQRTWSVFGQNSRARIGRFLKARRLAHRQPIFPAPKPCRRRRGDGFCEFRASAGWRPFPRRTCLLEAGGAGAAWGFPPWPFGKTLKIDEAVAASHAPPWEPPSAGAGAGRRQLVALPQRRTRRPRGSLVSASPQA